MMLVVALKTYVVAVGQDSETAYDYEGNNQLIFWKMNYMERNTHAHTLANRSRIILQTLLPSTPVLTAKDVQYTFLVN